MTAASNERAAALAAIQDEGSDAAPQLERTGRDVYAGGDEARLLIARASTLGYVKAGVYHRAEAVPGDVVLLTKKQAARLDALGVTVSPEADLEDTLEEVEETGYTDEQLASMGAADLVTYVGRHRPRAPRGRAPRGRGGGRRRPAGPGRRPRPDGRRGRRGAAGQRRPRRRQQLAPGQRPR